MKFRNLVVFLVLAFFSTQLFSQKDRVEYLPSFDERKIHYGFYLGLNNNGFKVNYKPSIYSDANITVEPQIGFNVGLIADLRLHKNINLRFEPGLMSNTKSISFNHINTPKDSIREAGSTFLHLPVLLKFSTNRMDNVRPYVIAGVSYDYNFSSNEKNGDDNFAGEFRTKTHNFMYEVGIGIDIYLYFFKFSPSIRGVFSFNNEIIPDNIANGSSRWTNPINFLGTRGVFLNLAFE